MTTDRPHALDAQRLAAWYGEFSERLRAFLLGLLRDQHAAEEALQATFVKAASAGSMIHCGSEKPWLFQVAFNEAMAIRRRTNQERRVLSEWRPNGKALPEADVELLRSEAVQLVRQALEMLPADQKQVVQMRIYEEKTFQQIADALSLPLGTVLTRMRLALARLQCALKDRSEL